MSFDDKLLCDGASVAEVISAVRRAGRFALDLEFFSSGKYIPELCVVQLAWGQPEQPSMALIDALEAPLDGIWSLLTDSDVTVIAHAAKQDLQLIADRYGAKATSLFDTQIAAAFCGIGEQIGYAKLVRRICDVDLDKSSQFTDWTLRPLKPAQLRYALDDVRYLMTMQDELTTRLEEMGRLPWVAEECRALADSAASRPKPLEVYQQVSGVGGLKGKALGSLRELAAWREQIAIRDNTDAKKIRGIGQGTIRKYGSQIVHLIHEGGKQEPPPIAGKRPTQPELQARSAVVNALIQSRCAVGKIAARFVGTRSDAEQLVSLHAEGKHVQSTLVDGWRRDFVGDELVSWLEGGLAAVCGDDGMLYLEARSDVKSTS
jgi:ribonuclease D